MTHPLDPSRWGEPDRQWLYSLHRPGSKTSLVSPSGLYHFSPDENMLSTTQGTPAARAVLFFAGPMAERSVRWNSSQKKFTAVGE
jgi:hypothetical protein